MSFDSKQYYEKNKQVFLENARKWGDNNPEKRAATMRAHHYWKRYKITVRIYDRMLAQRFGL